MKTRSNSWRTSRVSLSDAQVTLGQAGTPDQLVDGAHQGTLGLGPALRIGTGGHPLDVGDVEAGVPGEDGVLGPLVLTPPHVCHPEDEQLALAGREG